MSIATGSSPLARGSHEGSVVGDAHGRIIPARAGFTRRPSSRYSPRWDHPRSRGVHRRARRARRRARGSSPLARGSPGHRVREPQRCRIIPARAGFTRPPSPPSRSPRDHPRSRGVHRRVGATRRRLCGSSPLARGSLDHPTRSGHYLRIIPARAGFTQAGGVLDRLLADHPRSRGVHLTAMSAARSSAGSSPLARGSLNRQLRESNLSGIIPARAGFTSRTRASRLLWSDHPRSRGVHDILDVLSGHASGSSPLARGSPRPLHDRRPRRRIIPARAGFTLGVRIRGCRRWDHPRSRGVHENVLDAADWVLGSSPLARGSRR